MRRKSIYVATFVMALAFASFASAQETPKQIKIEAMLRLIHNDVQMEQMMDQMFTQLKAMNPSSKAVTSEESAKQDAAQAQLVAFFKDRFSLDKMLPLYVKAYDDTFSEEEIDGIYAFYQSPAGYAMINKGPLLMPKIMAAVQAQILDLLQGMRNPDNDSTSSAPPQ